MASLDGRCLCDAVAFQVDPPTDFLSHCHCQSCRLAHGAAFVSWSSVPLSRFRYVRGEDRVKWYDSSDGVRWGFCATCGSSMLYHWTTKPDRMYFAAGSIVGPMDREAESHVSYEERVSWLDPGDAVAKYRGKEEERLD